MGRFYSVWTPEHDAELRQRWADGQTAGTIANAMNLTRNSVIGRAHRLRLAARPSPIRYGGVQAAAVAERKPARATTNRRPLATGERAGGANRRAKVAEVSPPASAAPVLRASPPPPLPGALTGGCRWPLWTDRERPTHRYCDATRAGFGPYCAAHRLVAYTPSRAAIRGDVPARVAGGEVFPKAIPAGLPVALHAPQHEEPAS